MFKQKSCKTCNFNVDRPDFKCPPTPYHCDDFCNWKEQDEIIENEHGARQSKTEYLWTDFCPRALLRVAKLSHAGCVKYGPDNWKKISKYDHIGHAITHMFKYLAGCKDEDHLAHAAWRVLAAMGVE